MLGYDGLPRSKRNDTRIFTAVAQAAGVGWQRYDVPTWATMVSIFLLGGGGGGGNGAVGAVSTAAGGGGGGSSSQTALLIPASMIPSSLYCSIGTGGANTTAGVASRVSVYPDTTANHCLAIANGGGAGGNAAGATAGAAGSAGSIATIATMPLAYCGLPQFLAGLAGIIGGTTVAGAAFTLPTTGQLVCGGTGGGGLPASGVGTAGGAYTTPASGLFFPPAAGGTGGASTTTPGGSGTNGMSSFNGLRYSYGGTGGGSSNAAATGAGLFGGAGGMGGFGSGGGGGGGCFTGGTAGVGGRGGDGICIITAW